MRTFKVVAAVATLLVHASATGTVAAQDDPATRFVVHDRRPNAPLDPSIDPPPIVVSPAVELGVYIKDIIPAPTAEPRDDFWFDNGFAKLHDQIGSVMGSAIEPEHAGNDDDVVQRTTTGLAVWKAGKTPTFTDGWRTWTVEPPAEQRTASVAAVPTIAYGVWDRLAGCEAGGNWANSANPRYKGGLQMDSTFWARYGGLAYASAPHLASRQAQITVAIRGQAVQGWQAWPTCSRILGLR